MGDKSGTKYSDGFVTSTLKSITDFLMHGPSSAKADEKQKGNKKKTLADQMGIGDRYK